MTDSDGKDEEMLEKLKIVMIWAIGQVERIEKDSKAKHFEAKSSKADKKNGKKL